MAVLNRTRVPSGTRSSRRTPLAQLMMLCGVSQRALARELGIAQTSISNYAARGSVPPPEIQERIVALLRPEPEDLWSNGGDAA